MSRYGAIVKKFGWSFRRRGVVGTLKVAMGRMGHGDEARAQAKQLVHPFDVEYGVETSGLVDGAGLMVGHANDAYSTAYWGVGPSRGREVLKRWMRDTDREPVEQVTFLDIGCGKGRMLLLASELPFRKVLGVDLNGDLARTAARNLVVWKSAGRARCSGEALQSDATEMALPPAPCLVFLYNPFGEPVLRKVLARLEENFAGQAGNVDVLYLFPECKQVFAENKAWGLLWRENFTQPEADANADPLARGDQICLAYRLKKTAASSM